MISSVRIANSFPCFTPRSFHSSVSSGSVASSIVSSIRSRTICDSHRLNGSAFGEGIDWMILRSCSVLATSVLYRFPSFDDFNFSCLQKDSFYLSKMVYYGRIMERSISDRPERRRRRRAYTYSIRQKINIQTRSTQDSA